MWFYSCCSAGYIKKWWCWFERFSLSLFAQSEVQGRSICFGSSIWRYSGFIQKTTYSKINIIFVACVCTWRHHSNPFGLWLTAGWLDISLSLRSWRRIQSSLRIALLLALPPPRPLPLPLMVFKITIIYNNLYSHNINKTGYDYVFDNIKCFLSGPQLELLLFTDTPYTCMDKWQQGFISLHHRCVFVALNQQCISNSRIYLQILYFALECECANK